MPKVERTPQKTAYAAKYYAANREEMLTRQKAYQEANRGKISVYQAEWYVMNRERANARNIAYNKANLQVGRTTQAKRRAIKRNATGVSSDIIKVFYSQADRLGKLLGIPFEVDHIVPLSKGGEHHQRNLQVIPATINKRKNAKMLDCPIWADPRFSLS